MAPQDPQAAALLAHVVSQIEQNVNFLASQNYISQADVSTILTALPNINYQHSNGTSGLVSQVSNMMHRPPPPPAPRSTPAPPSARLVEAMWPYSGDDENDLKFQVGDIIEIVEETNSDWWTGRVHGREGLFPSNYVKPTQQVAPAPAPTSTSSKVPYKPFGAAFHGVTVPPPPGQGVNNIGLQEQPGTEAKKDKFGEYKSTLAHSAVGGVGFGAGSAIGGGLVRAIF